MMLSGCSVHAGWKRKRAAPLFGAQKSEDVAALCELEHHVDAARVVECSMNLAAQSWMSARRSAGRGEEENWNLD
eukprot:1937503-Rhodomonas_salina.1